MALDPEEAAFAQDWRGFARHSDGAGAAGLVAGREGLG
jgi:hypothetical protein